MEFEQNEIVRVKPGIRPGETRNVRVKPGNNHQGHGNEKGLVVAIEFNHSGF